MTSEIKADKWSPASGTAGTIGDSGDTFTVPTGVGLTVTDEVKTNKISPASGTAFTIGDSGDTFTVPSGVTLANSGTATGFGGGKINQLLNTTAIVNTTTSSDAELMSLAITPSATSSKIYMLFTGTCQMGADEYGSWDFYRGSLASGSKILDGGETVFNGYNNIRLGFSMSYLDSPSTTSATTYTVVGSAIIGSIQYGATGRNTLTLMEVLA
jgi:hypothetical protein